MRFNGDEELGGQREDDSTKRLRRSPFAVRALCDHLNDYLDIRVDSGRRPRREIVVRMERTTSQPFVGEPRRAEERKRNLGDFMALS